MSKLCLGFSGLSTLHPQFRETSEFSSSQLQQYSQQAVHISDALWTRAHQPQLACTLETASQSPPDMTAGTLGFQLAAAPWFPVRAPPLCPPVIHPPAVAYLALQGFFFLSGDCDQTWPKQSRNFSAIQWATTISSSTRSEAPFQVGLLGHLLELSSHLNSLLSYHGLISLYIKLSPLKLLCAFCLLVVPRLIETLILFISRS